MVRGIIIFGASGSGKTTLGRAVAKKLGFPYFDIDDYIWRKDTAQQYTMMYSREEKASRLMEDITKQDHFVMAGSMSSFHEPFDPLFDLAVHLTADTAIRVERVHKRAIERFGNRVLEGGDIYENHRIFIDNVLRYDTDGSPNLSEQMRWAESLSCEVLHLSGEMPIERNSELVVKTYYGSIEETYSF